MTQAHATEEGTGPLIVGFGGSTRDGSSTNRVLTLALKAAEGAGARVLAFDGSILARLPHFTPEKSARTPEQLDFLDAVRRADGIIVASPGYHGGVSGLVKNALDLLEDLRDDGRQYLDGRAVGCIVVAAGCQAAVTTLQALRAIVHALRGWPTPFGATLNSAQPIFDKTGVCTNRKALEALELVGRQVVEFARFHRRQ